MLNRPSKAVVTRVVGIVGALVALSAFLVLSNVPGSVFGQETGVIMYAENGTAPVLTFTSEDPEGMGIHWDVTGVDADDFTISGGVLTFNDPPNFEKHNGQSALCSGFRWRWKHDRSRRSCRHRRRQHLPHNNPGQRNEAQRLHGPRPLHRDARHRRGHRQGRGRHGDVQPDTARGGHRDHGDPGRPGWNPYPHRSKWTIQNSVGTGTCPRYPTP